MHQWAEAAPGQLVLRPLDLHERVVPVLLLEEELQGLVVVLVPVLLHDAEETLRGDRRARILDDAALDCVKIKRNFGLQDDAVPLVEDARAALDEASATYPDVLAAVERVRSEECSEGHESIAMQSEGHESIESIESIESTESIESIEMYSSDEEF